METNCTVLLQQPFKEPLRVGDIKKKLESANEDDKVEAMKHTLGAMMRGEPLPGVLMHVIRFACTSNHHQLKKLLMIYWECVEKKGADGKLLPEMILVCNALRNDLNHPNEYIRGCTLRLCTKLREAEVLEPLVPSVTANLEHRHSYVRRNAVLAVFAIYKQFPRLIPHAPEVIGEYMQNESDTAACRNAFLMLFHCDQDRAVAQMHGALDRVQSMGDGFQLVVLELARKLCRAHPEDKSRYIKCIITLMDTASDSVLFECANTLVAVSNAPTAIRAAAGCYTQLLRSQADNSVKMVVLERLASLKDKHMAVLQDVVMDIFRGLQSPSTDVQLRTIELVLDVVTSRTVEEVVLTLKKEVLRLQSVPESKAGGNHRQALLNAIHKCATRFPEVAPNAVGVVVDFVSDVDAACALDAANFARDMAEMFPDLRDSVIEKLLLNFGDIKSATVYGRVLWVLGQYSLSETQVLRVLEEVKASVGELPLYKPPEEGEDAEGKVKAKRLPKTKAGPTVLVDGTYQSQSAVALEAAASSAKADCSLRAMAFEGTYSVFASLANCLTKLTLRLQSLQSSHHASTSLQVLAILVSVLRFGHSPAAKLQIDATTEERVGVCVRVITNPTPELVHLFLERCQEGLSGVLRALQGSTPKKATKAAAEPVAQADDVINFRQLKGVSNIMSQLDIEDEEFADVSRATGSNEKDDDSFAARLKRVVQLTGFSDPVYAEAHVVVHQYDIVLEFLVVNRTNETMQNLTLELSTFGDLKLCERPQPVNLAPGTSKQVKANFKLSSTDTGMIFGNVVYETSSSSNADKNCVVLNSVMVDILDYIKPAPCTDAEFKKMWAMFEWENKIAVNTDVKELRAYINHVAKLTNMEVVTPESAMHGSSRFLAVNMHAKTAFQEHALLNVSVEKLDDRLLGHVRIRSKTQGVALGLGDKVTMGQKAAK